MAVELALLAVPLVAILLFVAALGRFSDARNQVDEAARDAARQASTYLSRSPPPNRPTRSPNRSVRGMRPPPHHRRHQPTSTRRPGHRHRRLRRPLGDLLLLELPGSKTVTPSSTSVVDTYVQATERHEPAQRTRLRRTRFRRARCGESGSVTVFVVGILLALIVTAGLVFDGGSIIAGHREADAEAEGAARAAAEQVATAALHAGTVSIDPAHARAAAEVYLSAYHHSGTVSVDGDQVTVTVTFPVDMQVLSILGPTPRP